MPFHVKLPTEGPGKREGEKTKTLYAAYWQGKYNHVILEVCKIMEGSPRQCMLGDAVEEIMKARVH
jgi:hypothetical protein